MTSKPKVTGSQTAAKSAYWDARITEWKHSGQSQKGFCAQRDLAPSTFQWWRSREKRRAAKKSAPAFLPITMGAMGMLNVVEIELRSRTRIRFEGEAALQAVAQLVARVK